MRIKGNTVKSWWKSSYKFILNSFKDAVMLNILSLYEYIPMNICTEKW